MRGCASWNIAVLIVQAQVEPEVLMMDVLKCRMQENEVVDFGRGGASH